MDRRGIPQTVIMKIMGLLTDAIFRRYRISGHADLVDAARKMDRTVGAQLEASQTETIVVN
jgi:hypothetical protein